MIKKIIIRKQIPAPSIILNKSVVEWNHMSALGKQTVEPILYLCFSILSDIITAGKGITNPEFMKNGHWFMSYINICNRIYKWDTRIQVMNVSWIGYMKAL